MARVRGRDPQRCLVVPVVGKSKASALVADHYGELVVEPFEFALTESGFARLWRHRAPGPRADVRPRSCGSGSSPPRPRRAPWRRKLRGRRAQPAGRQGVGSQQLLARLKSDARDLGAMAELMVRGSGRPPAT
ncbi:MAG: hypothetical protein ACREJP_02665, partial [Candidatus Methylomirabilales bacterium]